MQVKPPSRAGGDYRRARIHRGRRTALFAPQALLAALNVLVEWSLISSWGRRGGGNVVRPLTRLIELLAARV